MTANADGIWKDEPADVVAGKKMKRPKRKYRWGMLEVIGSVVILFAVQLAISIVFIAFLVAEAVAKSTGGLDEQKIYDDLLASVSSSGPLIFGTSVAMYSVWGLTMWYCTRFRGKKSWKRDFWLSFHRHDWWKGGLLAFGLLAVEYAIMFTLSALNVDTSGSNNSQVFLDMEGFWFYVLCIFMVPILGPIFEELFFRGFLLQGLIRWFRHGNNQGPKTAFGDWWLNNFAFVYNGFLDFRHWVYRHTYTLAILISSALFGLMHFQGSNTVGSWLVVFLTGGIGLAFAIVTLRTRRLGIAIWGHMFFNGTTMALALSM